MKTLFLSIAKKYDIVLFCVGLLYVLLMSYGDVVAHKETPVDKESEIMNSNLSEVCITDANNITTCISLNKSVYQIRLESEGHSVYKLHLISKDR